MATKKLAMCLAVAAAISATLAIFAQTEASPKNIQPSVSQTPRGTSTITVNSNRQTEISRVTREQAYAKLLEGQRYIWNINHAHSSSAAVLATALLAKQSLQKAIELDPNLDEAYTALAELSLNTPPGNIEDAVKFADAAVKIRADNFGARRILAFAYSIKSNLNNSSIPDPIYMQKAIAEWKEVARLDPRFSEAWAFLSEFYDKTNKNDERIEALKKWQASAPPIETRFYRSIMGAQETLQPDSAELKLGAALIKGNRATEAIEVLSLAISDEPENTDVVDLLRQAVENGSGQTSAATIQALQQAVFANPTNVALIQLLARVQIRAGQTNEAAKILRLSVSKLAESDKNSAALLQISLGDVYAGVNQTGEAVAAYEEALKMQGIEKDTDITEEQREIAAQTFGKIIQTYKNAGKINEAKAAIERARLLFGKDDLFADKQIISLLRETGRKQEALEAVRNLRLRVKDDYGLIRLESALLTDLGRVGEGVKLIKTLLSKQLAPNHKSGAIKNGENPNGSWNSKTPPSPYYDDFSNYIFISSLYNQAKRGNEAIEAARQASSVAESEDRKQIAELSLATAQQTAGNFQSAEEILRNLLKKSPRNPVALNNLGYFLLERNEKLDEAISLIRQALNIDPTNSSYLDSLGWAYFKQGKLGEAELYLKEAIRDESASSAVYEHLGDVYHQQGKFELARSAWQKAINITSDSDSENRLKEKLGSRLTK